MGTRNVSGIPACAFHSQAILSSETVSSRPSPVTVALSIAAVRTPAASPGAPPHLGRNLRNLWPDLNMGRITGRISGLPGTVHTLSYSKDGRLLAAVTGAGALTVYDLERARVAAEDSAGGSVTASASLHWLAGDHPPWMGRSGLRPEFSITARFSLPEGAPMAYRGHAGSDPDRRGSDRCARRLYPLYRRPQTGDPAFG